MPQWPTRLRPRQRGARDAASLRASNGQSTTVLSERMVVAYKLTRVGLGLPSFTPDRKGHCLTWSQGLLLRLPSAILGYLLLRWPKGDTKP